MKLIHVKSKRVKIGNVCQYLLLFPQRRQLFTIFAQYPTFLPICTGDNPLLQSIYAQAAAAAPPPFHAFSLLMKTARWVKWPRGGPDKMSRGLSCLLLWEEFFFKHLFHVINLGMVQWITTTELTVDRILQR